MFENVSKARNQNRTVIRSLLNLVPSWRKTKDELDSQCDLLWKTTAPRHTFPLRRFWARIRCAKVVSGSSKDFRGHKFLWRRNERNLSSSNVDQDIFSVERTGHSARRSKRTLVSTYKLFDEKACGWRNSFI